MGAGAIHPTAPDSPIHTESGTTRVPVNVGSWTLAHLSLTGSAPNRRQGTGSRLPAHLRLAERVTRGVLGNWGFGPLSRCPAPLVPSSPGKQNSSLGWKILASPTGDDMTRQTHRAAGATRRRRTRRVTAIASLAAAFSISESVTVPTTVDAKDYAARRQPS